MYDFFSRQSEAQRRTARLVPLFFAAAVLCNFVAAMIILGPMSWVATGSWISPGYVALALGISLAATTGVVVVQSRRLARGGAIVALELGGRSITRSTRDDDERRLLNVVEEMAIAAGCPVPPVFVLDRELAMNAFAAGNTPEDAVIGITKGALARLDRDELQGVMAHEFSHILNGDMRLNQRLLAMVYAIGIVPYLSEALTDMAEASAARQWRRYDRDEAHEGGALLMLLHPALWPVLLMVTLLTILGCVSLLVGRLLKGAVSYQREFEADATAVQFTRNPDGIASALKKIGGLGRGSRLRSHRAEVVSHLMFSGNRVSGGSLTHPALGERIRRIDPRWDGAFPDVELMVRMPGEAISTAVDGTTAAALPTDGPAREPALIQRSRGEQATPDEWLERHAPANVLRSASHAEGATALLCALLLDGDGPLRERQLGFVGAMGPHVAEQAEELFRATRPLVPALSLALVDRALPALHDLSKADYDGLRALLERLVAADGQVDLFELALLKVIVRKLGHRVDPPKRAAQQLTLNGLAPEIDVLLSALCHLGGSGTGELSRGYTQGLETEPRPLLPIGRCSLEAIDQAIGRIEFAYVNAKLKLMHACAAVVEVDGLVSAGQLMLLRAIAAGIDAPSPPISGLLPSPRATGEMPDAMPLKATPLALGARIGQPGVDSLGFAEQLLTGLPPVLRGATTEPFGAQALTFALLLSADPSARAEQLEVLDEPARDECQRLARALEPLGRSAALPLAELCLPALRQLDSARRKALRERLRQVIRAGGEVELFAFALYQMLRDQLRGRSKRATTHVVLATLTESLSILLSALARQAGSDDATVVAAFDRAVAALPLGADRIQPRLLPAHLTTLREVGEALDQVNSASLPLRRSVVAAATAAVIADDIVTVGEAELLRAISAILGCPLPPLTGTLVPPDDAARCQVQLPDELPAEPAGDDGERADDAPPSA